MTAPYPVRFLLNPRHGVPGVVLLPESGFRRAAAEIRGWPGHAPAALVPRAEAAAAMGLSSLHEARGAGAGLAYAMARRLRAELARRGQSADGRDEITFACHDGDEDDVREAARVAEHLGAACVVLGARQEHRGALAALGARIIEGVRDDPLREAERQGWLFISGTAQPGYTEVPRDVMQGHRLLAEEAFEALPAPPTHVVVPGGAGGLAAAVAVQARARHGMDPRILVVEPGEDARLMALAEGRAPAGMPSILAWQELERSAFAFLPGAEPLSALRGLARDQQARGALGLDALARVLVFSGASASSELHRTAKPLS